MAVIEPKKEPVSVKTILFVVGLIIGAIALGAGFYYMTFRPAGPRQVKLTEAQAQAQAETIVQPAPALPPAPPLPQAKDPGPTLVTLDLKQVTARQALAELMKQSKGNFKLAAPDADGILAAIMTPRFDVSIKDQPFWPAMIDLCRKGKLAPYSEWNSPNEVSFRQNSSDFAPGPSKSVGSCFIVLERVTSNFDADLVNARPTGRRLRVQMTLFVEPRLTPYRISSVATIESAVDENGVSLSQPRDPWQDRDNGGPRSIWMKEVNCHLSFPDSAGQKIARLKGYVSVVVAGPEQTQKIENPLSAKNVATTVEGVVAHLIEVRKSGSNDYVVRMAGDLNSPVFKDYDRFSKIVALFDANGKEFNRNGGGWGGGRGGTMEFSINFSGPSDSSELKEARITLPSQLKEIRVPFEFKHLPLPH